MRACGVVMRMECVPEWRRALSVKMVAAASPPHAAQLPSAVPGPEELASKPPLKTRFDACASRVGSATACGCGRLAGGGRR